MPLLPRLSFGRFLLLLLALLATTSFLSARNAADPAVMELMAVAERTPEGDVLVERSTREPIRCLLLQGIFIQPNPYRSGVHWDPPASDIVTRALEQALMARNYVSARTSDLTPDVVITYHWGISFGYSSLHEPSARLNHTSADLKVRNSLAIGGMPHSSPTLNGHRAFIVVTAYDYAALTMNVMKPLWRTKLSTSTLEGSLTRVLPGLALGGAKHYGASYPLREWETIPQGAAVAPAANINEAIAEPSKPNIYVPETKALDSEALFDLLRLEVLEFSGRISRTYSTWQMQGMSLASSLPTRLNALIADYEKERSKVETNLRAALKTVPPGEATRRATQEFLNKHARTISSLDAKRERIHSQLSQLASAGKPPKTVDALLAEFSARRRSLLEDEAEPNP